MGWFLVTPWSEPTSCEECNQNATVYRKGTFGFQSGLQWITLGYAAFKQQIVGRTEEKRYWAK